ncbi:hypothetical protein BDN71DRAFT_832158 [Pleurotus eryngii]|uniref:Uncharacterized protein n=1 Tax=Pleurotus eryngii TaxID=5323 RepID=A0A9P6A8H1_PLEER|nr:hypothetical protein BDN71DRAFT_832158 [Pleurotus eryngii]
MADFCPCAVMIYIRLSLLQSWTNSTSTPWQEIDHLSRTMASRWAIPLKLFCAFKGHAVDGSSSS